MCMIRMCTISKWPVSQYRENLEGVRMNPSVNRQVILASRPQGIQQAEHFRVPEFRRLRGNRRDEAS